MPWAIKQSTESQVAKGYDYFLSSSQFFVGAARASALNGAYIQNIDNRIMQLAWRINSSAMKLDGEISGNKSLHGFIAEYWHAYTYRISAAAMRTNSWAIAEDSPDARAVLGGPDITTSWDEQFSLKFYEEGKDSGLEQARTLKQEYNDYLKKHPDCTQEEFLKTKGLDENTDLNLSKYESQTRLIPAGQLKDAREALQRRIDQYLDSGSEAQAANVKALIETRDRLTDHIEGPNGEKSFPLTFEQSKQLQECAKEGSFDPADYDITAARVADRAYLMQKIINSGLTAMWTSALLKVAPEILACLKKELDDGVITYEDIANIGKAGAAGAANGVIRGTLIAAITTAAELGYLGDAIKNAASTPSFPSGIAVLVTTAMSIASDSISWVRKEIPKEEFLYRVDRTTFIAASSYICGVAVQGILLEFPTVGYLLGSFLGSLIGGALFSVKEEFFISACVDHGWTFFGIVKQDYSLPDYILRLMGFDLVDYDLVDYDEVSYDEVTYDEVTYDEVTYDEIDAQYIGRGLIGIRKVGYLVL